MQYLRSARMRLCQETVFVCICVHLSLWIYMCASTITQSTLYSRTYTKYDKSNACNFKLFGSATVIYRIFNAFENVECEQEKESERVRILKSHKSQSMHIQWKYILKSTTKENCAELTKGKTRSQINLNAILAFFPASFAPF